MVRELRAVDALNAVAAPYDMVAISVNGQICIKQEVYAQNRRYVRFNAAHVKKPAVVVRL